MDSYIKIRNLTFRRGQRDIFAGASFDIPRGKVTAIMGPSGTGKTTLLKLIGAQLKPQKGSVEIDGINMHRLSRKQLFDMRRKIGMLFQSAALFSNMSVYENIAFPLRVHTQLAEAMIRDIVLMKLETVGLRGAKHLMPAELSGGMSRRVALARTVALDPDLIMYDEPFTGLDPIAKGVIVKLIRELNDALGVTSILVTHDVTDALTIADYVYIVSEGKVLGQGKPDELAALDVIPEINQFIHGLPDGAIPFHYPAAEYLAELLNEEAQAA